MDLKKLLDVIRTGAAAFLPGSMAAMEAAEAIVALVRNVQPTLKQEDQTILAQALEPLLLKMNAAVDQAIQDLT